VEKWEARSGFHFSMLADLLADFRIGFIALMAASISMKTISGMGRQTARLISPETSSATSESGRET
jgi:hypothetical protein